MTSNSHLQRKKSYQAGEIQQKVTAFKSSGLSQKEFCRQHDLKSSTFKNWLYRFEKGENTLGDFSPFIPVQIKDEEGVRPALAAVSPDLQLHYGSYTLVIPAGFDAATLRRVLPILGA